MRQLSFLILFVQLASLHAYAQTPDFRSPLDIPLYLAGNFGELRSNHFHTGLDIKTQGREGLPVYSVAEGEVSRIKVSPWGYGNALYIDHPSGHTTVYAHLQSYNEAITQFLRAAQYTEETYAIDLVPGPGQLKIGKGEIIGLSGNTGSSGGPHLHFEIRDTESEHPLNPMNFGFDIKDEIAPALNGILFTPLNDSSSVNGSNASTEKTSLVSGSTLVRMWGEVGLAISTYDKLSGQPNKCGTYDVELRLDGEPIYSHSLDELDFDVNRHMNAHIDYKFYRTNKKRYQRCFILPGNKLKIYEDAAQGLSIREEGSHEIEIVLKDLNGNERTFSFKVKVELPDEPHDLVHCADCKTFRFDTVNAYRSENCTVFVPEGRLYDDMEFEHVEKAGNKGTYSGIHQIGSTLVPLQNVVTVKLKADEVNFDTRKLVIAQRKANGNWKSIGGRFNHGWVEAKTKNWGNYTVKADTVPPVISNINLNTRMQGKKSFAIKVTDDFSGIDSYRGSIDGRWVLMEYQPRKNRLVYTFDESRLAKGEHTFHLVVADERKNENQFTMEFSW